MATITIKDLSENLALDRKAMQSIMGGARLGAGARARPSAAPRIVDFKTGAAPPAAPGKKTR